MDSGCLRDFLRGFEISCEPISNVLKDPVKVKMCPGQLALVLDDCLPFLIGCFFEVPYSSKSLSKRFKVLLPIPLAWNRPCQYKQSVALFNSEKAPHTIDLVSGMTNARRIFRQLPIIGHLVKVRSKAKIVTFPLSATETGLITAAYPNLTKRLPRG